MTRLSAAQIRGCSGPQKQDRPREGTILRTYYDRFLSKEAIRLSDLTKGQIHAILRQLKDYDLEIISERDPECTDPWRQRRLYRCIGIWDGDHLRTLEDVEVAIENSINKDAI